MREAVNEALKEAMKSRDAARVSALRMISAAFKDRDILARGQGAASASDEELVAALAKMIRQREESAKAFDRWRPPGARGEGAGGDRGDPRLPAEADVGGGDPRSGCRQRSRRPALPRSATWAR